MQFRSISELCDLIRNNLSLIPKDVDLIVGIPRSGLFVANYIALLMNKPLTDVDGLLDGRIISSGLTKDTSRNIRRISECKKALIVDDSIASGRSMEQCKKKLKGISSNINLCYCVIYALPSSRKMVDICFEVLEDPRLFEWNMFSQKSYLARMCFDIDGVLCDDPSMTQNDDGPKYIDFLKNTKPKIRPTGEVAYLVTSRLEKYRALTEEWLTRNRIEYGALKMLDSTAEERIHNNLHASFKADFYKTSDALLFVESDNNQAIEIHNRTRKPVYCVETGKFYEGDKVYSIKYETGTKMRAFLRKSRIMRKLYYTCFKSGN